ncbi:unnamed protein product [marine sediment metagenome]|uniref:Uncharacterized protein n=1 Tax=marine sediment metagenome TaxID=412755 RepID=X0TGU6_9ZZZZ
MTPKDDKTDELCIPKDEACDYLKFGLDAADFIDTELANLKEQGILLPEIEGRVKKMRRKLKAAEKKWELSHE